MKNKNKNKNKNKSKLKCLLLKQKPIDLGGNRLNFYYNKNKIILNAVSKVLKRVGAIRETVTLCSFANFVGLAFGSSQK